MEPLRTIYLQSGNLHHAYFLVGEKDSTSLALDTFLSNDVGFGISGNPDFFRKEFVTLTIDGARDIAVLQEAKSFAEGMGKKVFVISAEVITEEAQNALLKVFEEPTPGTHFFIISPQDILLPTLRSRMQTIRVGNETAEETEKVLDLDLKERMEKVKGITDSIKDEEGTKQDAISLLNQIEKELYSRGVVEHESSLRICEDARLALYDRGAPVKMILENVMLSI